MLDNYELEMKPRRTSIFSWMRKFLHQLQTTEEVGMK